MSTDNELLLKLAAAMVANPKATIKELAESAGISKATLHRFCGTRKNLEDLLFRKSSDAVEDIIRVANQEYEDYEAGLDDLIKIHLKYREYIKLSFFYPEMAEDYNWDKYLDAMDSFFLRGQKSGFFKIEFSDAFFSEFLASAICGLLDAVDRGRVAPKGLTESIRNLLLFGCRDHK